MKRIAFLIVTVLIFGMILSSCNFEKAESQETKIEGNLYVMIAKSTTDSSNIKLDSLFTCDDIVSFITTCESNCDAFIGKFIFADLETDDLLYSIGLYKTLYFYIGETLLFDPPIKIINPVSSYMPDDLKITFGDNTFILSEWYRSPEHDDWLSAAEKKEKKEEHERISKMRKKQLNVFFKYLNDNGKLEKQD